MTDRIRQAVLGALGDGRTVFVFPSEIAASSWLTRTLVETGAKALPNHRFIGWDAFKAQVFAGDEGARPATKVVRTLFARLAMDGNAHEPFLLTMPPPGKAALSARFAPMVAKALPALRQIPEGDSPYLQDWRTIRERYLAFMAERGLYETAWVQRRADIPACPYILAYPDLTEDWTDYMEAVMAMPGARVLLAPDIPVQAVKAARFPTLVDETRAILLKIRGALAAGTDPAGIMISVADPDGTLPVLVREAAVAGVRLDLREGKPLVGSAGGRLITDIVAVARTGRSFEAMRRLLLDLSRPWRNPCTAGQLIRLGVEKHILAPIPGQSGDIWELSMDEKGDKGIRGFYRKLRLQCDKVATATSFSALRVAVDTFKQVFLDDEAWDETQNDEIARCMAELEILEESAKAAGIETIGKAADIWLEHLESVRYLKVSKQAGIPVYRFPAAAGVMPDLHFVMNLSLKAAVAAARPLSFLRDDERQKAGACDRDISGGLIRLLAGSGDTVYLSWADEGPEGTRSPHPAIASTSPESLGLPYLRASWLPNMEEDFSALAELPLVFPAQKTGAVMALSTVLDGRDLPWSTGYPDHPIVMASDIRTRIQASLSGDDGQLRLSDTALEEYRDCAFKRIFGKHLKVQAMETGLSFIDARILGSIYHDAFQRCFQPLAGTGRAIVDAAEVGEGTRPGETEVAAAIEEAARNEGTRLGPFASLLLESALPKMRSSFISAMAKARAVLDGQIPVLVEETGLLAPTEIDGVQLAGRPDLVCIDSTGEARCPMATILDYKKSGLPQKKDLRPDADGRLRKLQLPLYARLVSEAGYQPVRAAYLSVEDSKNAVRFVFSD
ncbi:MAG: PD-(D/E)XK nuclease family protein, partial [Spirochaetota bacterium]